MDRPESESFLDQTIALWQPCCTRTLDREDARQIIENAVGFFNVLAEWDDEAGSGDSSPQRGGESL